jgi:hypothetical protein
MFTATPRNDYLFGEDFQDGLDSPSSQLTAEEIRKAAHVVNGGEVALTQCPSCRGTGRFRTYSGRDGGACFKCKGKGGITTRQVGAIKAKATKEANQAAWREEHAAALTYIHKRAAKSTFYGSFLDKLTAYGTLTEGQMAVVYKDMAADAAFWEAKKAERAAAAPKVDMTAITALFDRAPVKLVKKPIFRTVDLTIKKAPMTGRNPGALYVTATDGGEYLGKVVDGTFHKAYEAPADTAQKLMAVAVDPTAEAIKYAAKFGACCCCGKALVNPVSVLAVVGPVCGPRWGLDHLRLAAAEMLAAEKAEEILATRAGGQ